MGGSKTIEEMTRVARIGVLITTPYAERRQFVTCPRCTCEFDPFHHLRSFDDSTLSALFPGFQRSARKWSGRAAPPLLSLRE